MLFDGIVPVAGSLGQVNPQAILQNALLWVQNLGAIGTIAFIAIYVLATILFIPASFLTLGGGALFGVVWGTVFVFVGASVGATLAFLIGRYLAQGWVIKQIEGNDKLSAINAAIAREGFKIVLLTRLSPIFPFNLLNYALSITQVSLKDYLYGFIGMVPGTVLYVYLGAVIGDVADLTSKRERTSTEWILYGVGLVATVAVVIYVTQLARKALNERLEL
ncbi:TVP38/TMEM64 family protein [Kovacikia minuta CCNUW1]|uniref:TVP38/TMEM64 family protein n=1 Tax=Kovacikia minuta TaxID=2931930 RepID=UPI001CD01F62|nr:TVP38/TMEM64 family protein [Kovacikia minuta]UBF29366.1 TVP38/TMEM64 family protein [Kovacikia minuta CCNUW1]